MTLPLKQCILSPKCYLYKEHIDNVIIWSDNNLHYGLRFCNVCVYINVCATFIIIILINYNRVVKWPLYVF